MDAQCGIAISVIFDQSTTSARGIDSRMSSPKQGKFTAFTRMVIVEALPSPSRIFHKLIKWITPNPGTSSVRSSYHTIMSAPLCCQVQDARHLHFGMADNQFYPAHAHLSVSCLKRFSVMVMCTRAFIELNRIN